MGSPKIWNMLRGEKVVVWLYFGLWTPGVEIQNYSHQRTNTKVCPSPAKLQWKFTGFYGHLDPSKRPKTWNLLQHIARMDLIPWVCLGDFNEIPSANENYGGSRRQRGLM